MMPAILSLDHARNRLQLEVDLGFLAAVLLVAVVAGGLVAALTQAPGYGVMTETYLVD